MGLERYASKHTSFFIDLQALCWSISPFVLPCYLAFEMCIDPIVLCVCRDGEDSSAYSWCFSLTTGKDRVYYEITQILTYVIKIRKIGSTQAMSTSTPSSLAERLRAARLAANKTQQELAGDRYSKAYISAIECGKMTPSVQALGLLAERLGLPASYFLGEGEADLAALAPGNAPAGLRPRNAQQQREEEVLLALAEAEGWLRQGQPDKALPLLETLESPPAELPRWEQPRWYWLAGWALQDVGRVAEAADLLARGLAVTEEMAQQALPVDRSYLTALAERLRCALGVCEAAQGQVDQALERHQRGWATIQAEPVIDASLLLPLALALGKDLLTLGRSEEAQPLYAATQPFLEESDHLQAQTASAWERAQAYKARGQWRQAMRNIQQALTGWALLDAQQQVAQVQALRGSALLQRKDYADAEQTLRQGLERAEQTGDVQTRGTALYTLARLFLEQGNAAQALASAEEARQVAAQQGDLRAQGQVSLILAAAAEAQGQMDAAETAYKDALKALEQKTYSALRSEVHERYGQFLQRQQRYEEAFQQMRLALTH
jgi:transcriptional regulator with XRE-family HTH domain